MPTVDAMTATFILLALIVMSVLAPWFGADSRGLSTDGRSDFYPATPADHGTLGTAGTPATSGSEAA